MRADRTIEAQKENVMRNKKGMHRTATLVAIGLVAALSITFVAVGPKPALADDLQDAQQLVEKARLTFETFVADKQYEGMLTLVQRAKGVLIYPQVLRGAFIFGVAGGSGVFLARAEQANQWSGPAFYTIGEASFGLQAGGDAAEIVLVALTDRGVSALQATSAKLGADASVALGPIGAGASAATANLSADIISFARSKGLYAGISVQGAVVATRGGLNRAYYGQDVTPTDILIKRTVTNPQAAGLIQAIAKAGGGR
jgi:lipid-binding SYLF domain-containing protein